MESRLSDSCVLAAKISGVTTVLIVVFWLRSYLESRLSDSCVQAVKLSGVTTV